MVPVKHVHAMSVPFLQVVPDSLIKLLLDIERMCVIVARDHIFELVSFLESECVKMDYLFKYRSAPRIICYQLD